MFYGLCYSDNINILKEQLMKVFSFILSEWRHENQPGRVQGHCQHAGGVVRDHCQHEAPKLSICECAA